MRAHVRNQDSQPWGYVGMALLAGGLLVGCRSLAVRDGPCADWESPRDLAEPLLPEQLALAEALAHFAVANGHEANRRFERALEAYDRARAADPGYLPTHMRIAINLLRLGRGEEAAALLRDLAEERPYQAQPLIWLGSVYRQMQRIPEALEVYASALAQTPEEAALYVTMADLWLQLGQEEEALAKLETGIERADGTAAIRRVRGELLMRRAATAADREQRQAWRAKARTDFEAALATTPNDTGLLSALADWHVRAGQWGSAIPYYERLLRLDPTDALALERLAQAYERLGQLDDAARTLERLAQRQPTNPRVFLALGRLYEALDLEERALVNYQLATQTGASDPTAFLRLGVLQMEGAPAAAIAALQKGRQQFPLDPRLPEMLGYVLFNEAHYAEAIAAFGAAVTAAEAEGIDPADTAMNLYLYYALAYYFTGQPEAAAPVLQPAVERQPSAVEAFTHFVFIDDDAERREQAVPVLEALATKLEGPAHWWTLKMLGYMHSFNKDYPQALDYLEQVYAAAADNATADEMLDARFFFWLGAAHERNENYARAEKFFYRCLELDPDHVEAYNYLAYMWAENEVNLDRAKTYVLRALADQPDSGAFIDTLGWIYFKQGRYQDAYREIRRALEMLPDDPVVLDHLGDIYWALEKPADAVAQWKKAYALNPDKEEIGKKLVARDVDLEALLDAESHPLPTDEQDALAVDDVYDEEAVPHEESESDGAGEGRTAGEGAHPEVPGAEVDVPTDEGQMQTEKE